MSKATKDVMSKIQLVEKAIVSGGGLQKSPSDVNGSQSPAIQEIDEEVRYEGSTRKSKSRSPPPFDISINPQNITIGAPGRSLIDPNLKVRIQMAYMKGYFTKNKNSPRNSSLVAPSLFNSGSGSLIRSRDLDMDNAYGISSNSGLP